MSYYAKDLNPPRRITELPEGYMLSNEIYEKYGIIPQALSNWKRLGKIETVYVQSRLAVKITPEFLELIKTRKKRKAKIPAGPDKYVNKKGEITNFHKWMKALPRGYMAKN